MHLPDGLLDAKTALLSSGIAAGAVAIALRGVKSALQPRQVPMLGLAAAFVFAAQMLNFPVLGGTSGHLIGGVLTSILLGPSAAILVMTCVLIVQCLMFADGGLLALGANVLNMAVVSVCGGYSVFKIFQTLFRMDIHRGAVFAAAFAAWSGTVLGSIFCAGELAMAHTIPWSIGFPAMFNVHLIIGIGEGLATGLILLAILRARPELLDSDSHPAGAFDFSALGYGLLLSFGLVLFVAPFACPWPDGLEKLAHKLGVPIKTIAAPLADYRFPLIGSASKATAIAGLIGTIVAFFASYGLARLAVPPIGSPRKHVSGGN